MRNVADISSSRMEVEDRAGRKFFGLLPIVPIPGRTRGRRGGRGDGIISVKGNP